MISSTQADVLAENEPFPGKIIRLRLITFDKGQEIELYDSLLSRWTVPYVPMGESCSSA